MYPSTQAVNRIQWFEAVVESPIHIDGKQAFHMWGVNSPRRGQKVLVAKANGKDRWIVVIPGRHDLCALTTEGARKCLRSVRRNGKVVYSASQAGASALNRYYWEMSR